MTSARAGARRLRIERVLSALAVGVMAVFIGVLVWFTERHM